jgi:acyl carrier protein
MTRDEKMIFIEEIISTVLKNPVKITENMSLIDIGLDSLDIVELQLAYEDKIGHELSNADQSVRTVGELLDILV